MIDTLNYPIAELPAALSYDEAVEAAYREDLDWIEEKLSSGLSVLVECDKQLANYIYKALRKRARSSGGPRLRLLSGHPRAPDPNNPMQGNATLTQRLLDELRDAIYNAAGDAILAITHLDILTTTTRSSLSVETREAAAIMYENPDLVFLGFTDPAFEIPTVIEKVFAVKHSLIGIARDKLPQLILQREARKFGVEVFNPFTLYKYVSGLNAVRCRQILNQIASRVDFDPNVPGSVDAIYRDIRRLTLLGDLEVPRVDLDGDIGGYGKVKDKIKTEILELLRMKDNSTSVEEIRAIEELVPKGMIFWGPPGTGKTFFAKAIATALNATVSIVSGPELKSKWVGESLPWEEPVLVTINGQARRIPIGELVERHAEDEVMAWTVDDEGRSLLSRVTGFITHDGPDYIDVLTTESGRQVRVTGGHSLFVNDNGRLAEVFAEEVIPHQTRIAVPLRLEAPEQLHEIDLLEAFRTDEQIHVSGADAALEKACEVIGFAEADRLAGVSMERVLRARQKPPLSVAAMWRVLDAAQVSPPAEGVKLYCWHRNKTMPSTLALTPELGEFLGFWTADGCFGKSRSVRLSVHAHEEEAIRTRCEHLFGHVTRHQGSRLGVDLTISSTLLYRVMTEVLEMTHGSAEKSVPAAIFMAPRETVAAFLRGYFSGDGSFSGKYIEATTTSEALAGDIATLLQYFGIGARLRLKQERHGRPAHRVRFLWSEYLRAFKEHIGFIQPEKQERLSAYLSEMTFQRDVQTPAQHIHEDLLWELVVSSHREPYSRPHVYDISVPGTERFIAGYGNILVHNSEENLRKVFSQARKSAPSIIIFDEMDSFASARGTYTGSGVEHSMVNQLLTEMDGFRKEELVFVVGTTNFEESLDPALLRPGRFELSIHIPYPGQVDRKEIVTIYHKKFRLNISEEVIDHIVSRTEHYADPRRHIRYSGDHLYALMRGLKREVLRKGEVDREITKEDVDTVIGQKRDKHNLNDHERRVVAVHEAGHALLAYVLPHCPSVERVTIDSELEGALGYVMHEMSQNQHMHSRAELLDDICVALGGREAELQVIGEMTTGCASDLHQATAIASYMVEEGGMSEHLGVRAYRNDPRLENSELVRLLKPREISEETATRVDAEIQRIIDAQAQRCTDTLVQYRAELDKITEILLEKKTIGIDEIKEIFGGHDFKLFKREKKKDGDAAAS